MCGSVAVGSYSDVRLGKTSHPVKIAGKGMYAYVCTVITVLMFTHVDFADSQNCRYLLQNIV